MIQRVCAFIVATLGLALITSPVVLAKEKDSGLTISPISQERSIAAGKPGSGKFTVVNHSNKSIDVSLSVEQFSVSDYKYDYSFFIPKNNLLRLDESDIKLQPHEQKDVIYSFMVPKDTLSGGYYFALFASTDVMQGSVKSTLRVPMLLYLTVDGNGEIVQAVNLKNEDILTLVTGGEIPYSYDAENTGNMHTDGYFYVNVDSLFSQFSQQKTYHTILPKSTKTIRGSLASPFLPGVYWLNYGYIAPNGTSTTKSKLIVYLPPWSIVALILLAVVGRYFWQRQHQAG